MELPTTVKDLTDKGFISARPVVVFPTIADRDCIAQGVVCPTVFNVKDRANHSPDVQASWFFRPMTPVDIGEIVPEHSESANLWYYDVDTLWKNVNDLSDKEKKDPLYHNGTHLVWTTMMKLVVVLSKLIHPSLEQ